MNQYHLLINHKQIVVVVEMNLIHVPNQVKKSPEYLEEEKPILPGIHVKGATLNRLIRLLIDSFREFERKYVLFYDLFFFFY